MPIRLISIGLPAIASVSIAGQEVPSETAAISEQQEKSTLSLNLAAWKKHALLVDLSGTSPRTTELACLLQPPSFKQRRLAKRRGWAKVRVDHPEGLSSPSIVCYWLKVRNLYIFKPSSCSEAIVVAR